MESKDSVIASTSPGAPAAEVVTAALDTAWLVLCRSGDDTNDTFKDFLDPAKRDADIAETAIAELISPAGGETARQLVSAMERAAEVFKFEEKLIKLFLYAKEDVMAKGYVVTGDDIDEKYFSVTSYLARVLGDGSDLHPSYREMHASALVAKRLADLAFMNKKFSVSTSRVEKAYVAMAALDDREFGLEESSGPKCDIAKEIERRMFALFLSVQATIQRDSKEDRKSLSTVEATTEDRYLVEFIMNRMHSVDVDDCFGRAFSVLCYFVGYLAAKFETGFRITVVDVFPPDKPENGDEK